jgi:hypothetical protein
MDCGNDLSLDPPLSAAVTATFAWQKDGKAIPGATQRTFVKMVAQASDSGVYQVQITESGSVKLGPKITVQMQSGNGSRSYLRNISSRGLAGAGENTMIVGFVCTGTGVRGIVLRAIGPGLSSMVNSYLPDPKMSLHDQNRKLDENNDWGAQGGDVMRYWFDEAGAFPLANGSKDSALYQNFMPGAYTALVSSEGSPGLVLMECYDASLMAELQNLKYGGKPPSSRLINISTRGTVQSGENVLIAGFILAGAGPQKLLIRGVGPSLSKLGVSGNLQSARLEVYRGSNAIAGNTGWATGEMSNAIRATTRQLGLWSLDEASSDAAVVLELLPGAYTAILASNDNRVGVGLLEVYEVDE